MFLVRFALKNPYAVVALTLGPVPVGSGRHRRMFPIDILPDFKKPVVVSYFSYPGLPTGEMEKSVTSRVERALTLAGGVEHQESRTMPGASMIKIFFHPGTNPSSAMNDIVNLEASDMFHLPPGIEFPFTLRSEPANLPVVLAAISGEGLSEKELYTIGYYAVRNKMGGLKGVQIPHPFGGKFRQMMIYVDPVKLQSFGLSAADVVKAVRDSNLVLAAGTVKIGRYANTRCIRSIRCRRPKTSTTCPSPCATGGRSSSATSATPRTTRRSSTTSSASTAIAASTARCCANRARTRSPWSIASTRGSPREIPKMKERGDIPEAAEVTLVSDQSSYIRNAMRNLMYEVGLGALLVTLVVGGFLRQFRPTLIIVATILLSILIGALAFYFTGHTINVMTLGGIALAVGTVVDAGIVVVENIVRHLRMGKSPHDAARDGAAEVVTPVLAGTVTTLAVFIPVIFLTGMIRFLFEPLSVAATMTIGASYLLGDDRRARLLCTVPAQPRSRAVGSRRDERMTTRSAIPRGLYGRCLAGALHARWLVIVLATARAGRRRRCCCCRGIGTELFPNVDAGSFEIRLKTIPGTRLEETEELVAEIEDTIKEVIPESEIEALISNIGLAGGQGGRVLDHPQPQLRARYGVHRRESDAVGAQHQHRRIRGTAAARVGRAFPARAVPVHQRQYCQRRA